MSTPDATRDVAPAAPAGRCDACGSPLAPDQRYCLHCGEVRPGARRAMPANPRDRVHVSEDIVPVARRERAPTSLAVTLGGIACLLVAMGVGVLIGRGSGDAAAPPPVTVAAQPATPATPAAAFTSDWDGDAPGWTVALALLPKSTTSADAVAAAKRAATGKGATAVGALDSDAFPSLAGGSYVVYSGAFASERAATDALEPLAAKFPGARVVRVAAHAAARTATPKAASKSPAAKRSSPTDEPAAGSPQQEFEKSKKAPKTVGTGGKPPPKDDKPAAGGGGFEEIG